MRSRTHLLVAAVLMLIIPLQIAFATGSQPPADPNAPLELTIMFADHAQFPYQDSFIWKDAFMDQSNADVEFMLVPDSDYKLKAQTMLNAGNAPDIIGKGGLDLMTEIPTYGVSGALVNVTKYYEAGDLPNMRSLVRNWRVEQDMATRFAADGNLYEFPFFTDKLSVATTILLRMDLIEKYGLSVPKTMAELISVMEVFKENNPDSIPFSSFNGTAQLYDHLARQYNARMGAWSAANALFLNPLTGEYESSYVEENGRALARDFADMYEKGLFDAETFTQDIDQWQNKMVTGRSFVFNGWIGQEDQLNALGQEYDADYNVQPIVLPTTEIFPDQLHFGSKWTGGWLVPTTSEQRSDFDRVLEFIDYWLYSDEGIETGQYGIEGVTFELTDEGYYSRLLPIDQLQKEYGLLNVGIYNMAKVFPEGDTNYWRINNRLNEEGTFAPAPVPAALTTEDQEELGPRTAALFDTAERWYQQFILGSKDLDADWQEFVSEMESKGLSEVLDRYNQILANQQ